MKAYLTRLGGKTLYLPESEHKIIRPQIKAFPSSYELEIFPGKEVEETQIPFFEARIQNPFFIPELRDSSKSIPLPLKEIKSLDREGERLLDFLVQDGKKIVGHQEIDLRCLGSTHSRKDVMTQFKKVENLLTWMNRFDAFYEALYQEANWVGNSRENHSD